MKAPTRKVVGIGLIAFAFVTGVLIQIFGTGVFSFRLESQPLPTMPTTLEVGFHWSAAVLAVIALAGLLCFVLPRRRHGDDRQSSV